MRFIRMNESRVNISRQNIFFYDYILRTDGVSNEGNWQQYLSIEWLYLIENFYSNRTYNIIRLDKFCHRGKSERWIVLMDRWSSSSDVCMQASDASIINTNIINWCWPFYHSLVFCLSILLCASHAYQISCLMRVLHLPMCYRHWCITQWVRVLRLCMIVYW